MMKFLKSPKFRNFSQVWKKFAWGTRPSLSPRGLRNSDQSILFDLERGRKALCSQHIQTTSTVSVHISTEQRTHAADMTANEICHQISVYSCIGYPSNCVLAWVWYHRRCSVEVTALHRFWLCLVIYVEYRRNITPVSRTIVSTTHENELWRGGWKLVYWISSQGEGEQVTSRINGSGRNCASHAFALGLWQQRPQYLSMSDSKLTSWSRSQYLGLVLSAFASTVKLLTLIGTISKEWEVWDPDTL